MFLNDTWKLWFHDPHCESWDEKSYIELASISTVEEIAEVYHAYKNIWNKGMFFLMREHIKPVWEDEHNANGGCFSYKVMKPEVPTQWLNLCARATGETLVVPEKRSDNWEKVCGISISPKRTYCILRIWISDASWNDERLYTVQLPAYTGMQFKTH